MVELSHLLRAIRCTSLGSTVTLSECQRGWKDMAGFSLTRCLNAVKLGMGELPDVSESESAAMGLRIKDP